MLSRRLLLLLVTVAVILSLVGVQATARAATDPKTLVVGIAENSTSLDPARGFEQQTSIVHKITYETLVTYPADGVSKIEPGLATSWKVSDDGKTYTFTLREGAVFSTGNPVTADDVVFSYNRLKNIKGNPSSLASTIDSIKAADPKTVVITLKQNDPALLAKLVFDAFSVSDSKAIKAQGGTDAAGADKDDKAEKWLNSNSVGTGPYVLTKWEKDNEMVFVKNEKYKGSKAPVFDKIIMKSMPKAATQKAALEGGDLDIAYDISADQVASIKGNADLKVFQGTSPIVFFLIMNQDKAIGGPMSDAKVQKAVRLSVDYAGILKLAGGAAATPGSIIPLGFAGAYPTEKAMKRDVEAAKKLLADAGMKDLNVELEYPDFTYMGINLGTLAQKIQADLKDVGITVKLKPAEVQVALANYRDGKEPFGLWFWGPDFMDALNYAEFLPNMKVGLRAKWSNDNSDKDVQALRDKVLSETDAAKRAELFGQIQAYWQEKGPFAPFLQPGIQFAHRATVKNVIYHPQWQIDLGIVSK